VPAFAGMTIEKRVPLAIFCSPLRNRDVSHATYLNSA
jgi:hypothetical protein